MIKYGIIAILFYHVLFGAVLLGVPIMGHIIITWLFGLYGPLAGALLVLLVAVLIVPLLTVFVLLFFERGLMFIGVYRLFGIRNLGGEQYA